MALKLLQALDNKHIPYTYTTSNHFIMRDILLSHGVEEEGMRKKTFIYADGTLLEAAQLDDVQFLNNLVISIAKKQDN